MSDPPTPALDALASEARAFIAEHWDVILADGAATSHDRRVRAAEAAARAACRMGPPESVGGIGPAAVDQVDRATRVLEAHVELQRLANELGPAGTIAANVLVGLDPRTRPGLSADGVTAQAFVRLAATIAHFLVHRPDGLIDDVVDLVRGAAGLEERAW